MVILDEEEKFLRCGGEQVVSLFGPSLDLHLRLVADVVGVMGHHRASKYKFLSIRMSEEHTNVARVASLSGDRV